MPQRPFGLQSIFDCGSYELQRERVLFRDQKPPCSGQCEARYAKVKRLLRKAVVRLQDQTEQLQSKCGSNAGLRERELH